MCGTSLDLFRAGACAGERSWADETLREPLVHTRKEESNSGQCLLWHWSRSHARANLRFVAEATRWGLTPFDSLLPPLSSLHRGSFLSALLPIVAAVALCRRVFPDHLVERGIRGCLTSPRPRRPLCLHPPHPQSFLPFSSVNRLFSGFTWSCGYYSAI